MKQLQKSEVSVNQQLAFAVIQNLFKSYFTDMIYPNDVITFQGGSIHKNDTTGACGSNEMGSRGLGPIHLVIGPVIQRVAVHIMKHYVDMVQLIIDNCLDDFYMLPVFLLRYAYEYSQDLPSNTKVCILPSPTDEPRSGDFLLDRHLSTYETILMEILRQKDTTPHEVQ